MTTSYAWRADVSAQVANLYQSAEWLTLQGFPNRPRHDSRWQTEGVCHGSHYSGADGQYRRRGSPGCPASETRAQARRLLAIAAVLDGASREEAARIGGMDRQPPRDWVIRFNEQGPDGLINIPSPGMPPKLKAMHKPFSPGS